MNGISKTFLSKKCLAKKQNKNYSLGSTIPNQLPSIPKSMIDKVFSSDIMLKNKCKPHLDGQLLLPLPRPSITFYNRPPRTTPSIDLTKFLVSLAIRDPMSWQLFMIALSSIFTETIKD